MGVVDTRVHIWSSKVDSFSSSICSEGKLGRMPMESGHRVGHLSLPKPKRRKISAIRDFPPGCGWFGTQISLGSGEEGTASGTVENSVDEFRKNDDKEIDFDKTSGKGILGSSQEIAQTSVSREILQQQSSGFTEDNPGLATDQVNKIELKKSECTTIPLQEFKPDECYDAPDTSHQIYEPEMMKAESGGLPFHGEILGVPDEPHKVYGLESMEDECSKMLLPDLELGKISKQGHNQLQELESGELFDVPGEANQLDEVELIKPEYPVIPLLEFESGEIFAMLKQAHDVQVAGSKEEIAPQSVSKSCSLPVLSIVPDNSLDKKLTRKYPPRRRISAVRDFPPYFGRPREEIEFPEKIAGEKSTTSPGGTSECRLDHKTESLTKTGDKNDERLDENTVRDIVVYRENKCFEVSFSDQSRRENQLQLEYSNDLEEVSNNILVQSLLKPEEKARKNGSSTGKRKVKKHDFALVPRPRPVQNTNNGKDNVSKINDYSSPSTKANQSMNKLVTVEETSFLENHDESKTSRIESRSCNFEVSLPPSGPSRRASAGDECDVISSRNKVKEALRLFQVVARKLLQEEEAKPQERSNSRKRIDLQAARILKDKGKYVNTGKQIMGSVPGVEVGDEFRFRVELNMIGLHRQIQGGIDYVKVGGKILATSIVSSGGYDDEVDNSDVLTYSGQGGNVMHKDQAPEDQKLERGNLALANSKHERNPVRVIRGSSSDAKMRTYTYDGLYVVEDLRQEQGPHGKLVFKFRLVRIPGQPELSWKVAKKSRKSEAREGLCINDISLGKELLPICAVNTIDDEKPPEFVYITSLKYPDWYLASSLKGCDCTSGCSESGKCSCILKNGGEIPYNHNGAIVQAKPLVYECGPSCKCPPSCHNRVTQHGIKLQLEIFKTESRGWGVRSLSSIPSGSFICEYVGELLEEKEANDRTGNDEYLFDIGHNFDASYWDELSSVLPEAQSTSSQYVDDTGFTIDAAEYGNVGRFINHSCSPNLYAQNILYDYEEKKIPHIMFFAMENIPPLQELTYHYNYSIDEVRDTNGNIKKKNCYCGSSECTGRMY